MREKAQPYVQFYVVREVYTPPPPPHTLLQTIHEYINTHIPF